MFFFAAALASTTPTPVDSPWTPVITASAEEDCTHPYAASFHPDKPRCAPRLSDASYAALDRRHRRAISRGFLASGIGAGTVGLGLVITTGALLYNSGAWGVVGANVMGLGLGIHAAGAIVGFRSLGLYDREYDELREGTARPEDLLARGCNLKVRATPTGIGGRF